MKPRPPRRRRSPGRVPRVSAAARAPAPRGRPARAARTSSSSPSTRCAPTGSAATATRPRPRPTLDALAARGVRFATAIAHVPLTGPSHASMLTGLTPLGHGVRDNGGFVLPAEVKTRGRGVPAGRVPHGRLRLRLPARPALRVRPRLRRPTTTTCPRGNDRRRTPYVERFADATTDAALRWLAAPRGRPAPGPFFLWVHYYDPHAPYEPPGELAERFRAAPYDGEIAFVDAPDRAAAARARGAGRARADARARDRRSRRGPRRARRGHARAVRLRLHAEGAVDHGRPGRSRRPRPGHRRPRHRRAADAARLRRPARARRPSTAARCGRPRRARRWATRPPTPSRSTPEREFGWAPLFAVAHGALQADRGAAAGAVRPRKRTRPRPTNRIARDAARRRRSCGGSCRPRWRDRRRRPPPRRWTRTPPSGSAALGYLGGGRAPGRARRRAGRDPKDGVRLMPRLNRGMSAARTDPAARDPRAHRRARRGSRPAHGAAHAAPSPTRRPGGTTARSPSCGGWRRTATSAPKTRSCSATTCASPAASPRRRRCCERAARENPRFAQPWLSLAEVHIKAGTATRRRRPPTSTCSRSCPTTSRRCAAWATSRCSRAARTTAAARYGRILEVDPADAGRA